MIRIKRGLILPISGEPEQVVYEAPSVRQVGIVPADYPGLDLCCDVIAGNRVRTGQLLFHDRRFPALRIVAPATGVIAFLADRKDASASTPIRQILTIDVEDDEFIEFDRVAPQDLPRLGRAAVVAQLLSAGLWPSLRTRPLQKVPRPDVIAHAIFVTAMDTRPLAARADRLIEAEQGAFSNGLAAISQLTVGLVYVCKAPAAYVPVPDIDNIKVEEFAGPHPAGLAGTHIHYLDPVGAGDDKQVWSIGYQDVIAIGKLFVEGRYAPQRVIALAGPQVIDPRLLRIRLGANIAELCASELRDACSSGGNHTTQLLAGSVLHGTDANGAHRFLGRDCLQVTALCAPAAQKKRGSFWGLHQFSVLPILLSRVIHRRRFRFTAEQAGNAYPLLFTVAFEKIWALRLLQLPLLRALMAGDDDRAIQLGALELVEEDLALATFVCSGKQDFGALLRALLDRYERDMMLRVPQEADRP
jgi:Na+-transporting NADH:ubiquinone oxidoreductase subunit A